MCMCIYIIYIHIYIYMYQPPVYIYTPPANKASLGWATNVGTALYKCHDCDDEIYIHETGRKKSPQT